MKRRRRPRGTTGLVALFLLLTALPLAILTLSSVRVASNAIREEVGRRVTSGAALTAAAIRRDMEGLTDVVESYAGRPTLLSALRDPRRPDLETIQFHLSELMQARPGVAAALLADPTGRLIAIVPATPSIVGQDFSYRDWYRGLTATGHTYVSEAYMSLATGHPLVVAASTFVRAPDGSAAARPVGILVVADSLTAIRGFVGRFGASQDLALTVTDQRGVVLAAPGSASAGLVSRAGDPGIAEALRGHSGRVTERRSGRKLLAAYAPVRGLGWTVTASVDEQNALGALGAVRSGVFAVAGILWVVLAVVLVYLARSVAARRRAVEETKDAKAFLESVVENIPNMVFVKDAEELRFVRINRAGEELIGHSRDELLGKNDHDFFPSDQAAFFTAKDREVLERGRLVDIPEESIDTKDGPRVLHTRKIPILHETGEPKYLLGISEDITERKRMEDTVRESEERYRLLVEAAPDMVFTLGTDGVFTSLNNGFDRITGWKREEWVGKEFAPLVHPDDLPAARERVGRMSRGEVLPPFQARLRTRSGDWASVESVSSPLMKDGEVVQILGIVRDITERKRAEEEVKQAKEEADRANKAKSEFLSRMSHELRTPLNSVLGFGQLLEMDDLNEEQRESVEQILKGGRHLLDLINEVLDISRIEAGRLSLSLETVSVRDALEEAIDLVRPLAREQGVELLPPSRESASLYVTADRQRLKQVLLNLLSNGVKYNRPGGALSVGCRSHESDGIGVIDVTDQGQGMTPEQVARLFTPFDRLGAEGSGIEGTGLGLALSKRLVEAMGGTLGVASEPGSGSTFSVRLALAQGIDEPLGDAPGRFPALTALGRGGARILYIEDNAANLKLIQRILGESPGIELLPAMQGSIGLDLARQHHPDLILLDLHLPDIRGDEVLRSLRADRRTRDIPVVMITADATEHQSRKLLADGAHSYLTKPLDVAKFMDTIRAILTEGRLDHAG